MDYELLINTRGAYHLYVMKLACLWVCVCVCVCLSVCLSIRKGLLPAMRTMILMKILQVTQ